MNDIENIRNFVQNSLDEEDRRAEQSTILTLTGMALGMLIGRIFKRS